MSEKGIIIFKCFECGSLKEVEITWYARNAHSQVVTLRIEKTLSCDKCFNKYTFELTEG